MDFEVVIVGAGPVGLMLAGELRLAGVNVAVIERRPTPSGESRGLGFTARAAEVMDQRGLLDRLGNVATSATGHFGGIPMDYSVVEGGHFGVRGVPQNRIEAMLEEWARELGATVLRGREVVDLVSTDDDVTVAVDSAGRNRFRARYLVCCDGGRSALRRLAAFDFPGTDATREMYLADVVGRGIRPRFIGERVDGGMVMSAPLEEGVDRIIVCEDGTAPNGRSEPSFTEVADAWQRLTGESLHGAEVRWVSAFTDATRLVTEYRRGRVLIAGDAAHVHLPAGGQGLSLGVQDAVNLGWKLAGTVRGWAPDDLLDTYHTERHPVAARVLRNTLAQGMLYLTGAKMAPLSEIMRELLTVPAVVRHLAGMVSGLDIRYDVGTSEHPLAGRRMPNRGLLRPDGQRLRVAQTLHAGRGVVIDTSPGGAVAASAGRWAGRVDVVTGAWEPIGPELVPAPETVLLRPDGYVAWATSGGGQLDEAMARWFGPADPAAPAHLSDSAAGASPVELAF